MEYDHDVVSSDKNTLSSLLTAVHTISVVLIVNNLHIVITKSKR